MRAYFHDNKTDTPFTDPHIDYTKPELTDNLELLEKLGIIYHHFNELDDVNKLSNERNYKNRDIIELSPLTFPTGPVEFQKKLDVFYQEHLHEDEEIRYIMKGTGYFDVRDKEDNWIRLFLAKGDLIILPAGIYHRFTMCSKPQIHTGEEEKNDELTKEESFEKGIMYVQALRLFKDEPKWLALNRNELNKEKIGGDLEIPSRLEYINSIKT